MASCRRTVSILGALLVAFSSLPVYAVTFTLGNNPQSDEENVLFSSSQTGTIIRGLTNQTKSNVQFTSSEILQTTAVGQANLTAIDGAINNVTIDVPGGTYGGFDYQSFGRLTGTAKGAGDSISAHRRGDLYL
jgi:hypothetical protein